MYYKKNFHKYGAKKVKIDGYSFDSKKEANYYLTLKLRKQAGDIKDFELQPEFVLQEAFNKKGKRYRAIKYIADFKIIHNTGEVEIVDVKGMETQVFNIKRKLFEKKYPKTVLTIV